MSAPNNSATLRRKALLFLLEGKPPTTLLFFQMTGSYSLAPRILELRKRGVPLENLGKGGAATLTDEYAVYRIAPKDLPLARQAFGYGQST